LEWQNHDVQNFVKARKIFFPTNHRHHTPRALRIDFYNPYGDLCPTPHTAALRVREINNGESARM